MKRFSKALGMLLAIGACSVSKAALADNPLGFYLGAGVGESTIRSDDSDYGYPGYYNDHQFAWKGIVGIRPISMLGVEAEYLDFGKPGNHHGYYDADYYGLDSHPRAALLFGVGYLPIPIPFVDFYAKAGVARLRLDVNDYINEACTEGTNDRCTTLIGRHSETDTKFAYGAGVESKLPIGFTVRAEYERIASQFGDPDAFTVSAVWRF